MIEKLNSTVSSYNGTRYLTETSSGYVSGYMGCLSDYNAALTQCLQEINITTKNKNKILDFFAIYNSKQTEALDKLRKDALTK